MSLEAYDHPVTEAMKRMRAFVLAKGPALIKAGGFTAGVTQEYLTPEEREQIARSLTEDMTLTYAQAAARWNVSEKTVFWIARRAGITRRKLRTDPAALAEAVRLVGTGVSQREACRRAGVQPTTLGRLLSK